MIINLAFHRDSTDHSIKVALKDSIMKGIMERKFPDLGEALKWVLQHEYVNPPTKMLPKV